MLTSKQRAYLRGLAAKEDTILQIGKDGITEKTAETMSDMLRARELVKGRVLENSMLTAREACEMPRRAGTGHRQQVRALQAQ